jgi:hypothetical protein
MASDFEDLADLVARTSVVGLVEGISSRMVTAAQSYKSLQANLSSLLFGTSAVISPSASLSLIIDCLEHACMRAEGEGGLPRLSGNPMSVMHLMVEMVSPRTVPSDEDLRRCAAAAAKLIERRCLVPQNARLAAKVVLLFRLTIDDFSDRQPLVDFVSQLLTERGTFSPAISLLMNLEGLDENFSKASILGDLVTENLDKTSEAWLRKLGREYQVRVLWLLGIFLVLCLMHSFSLSKGSLRGALHCPGQAQGCLHGRPDV